MFKVILYFPFPNPAASRFSRVLVPFIGDGVAKTKIWVLGVLTATEVSLRLDPPRDTAGNYMVMH